jgi:2C-methyl-D-erythritol 2,4-cyclodiphosphate synthase
MALEPPLAGKAAVMVAAALPKLVFEVGEGRGIACHAVVLLMSQA